MRLLGKVIGKKDRQAEAIYRERPNISLLAFKSSFLIGYTLRDFPFKTGWVYNVTGGNFAS